MSVVSPLQGILSDESKLDNSFKPLCFSRDAFNEEHFTVDQFLSDFRRRSLPLESVLADLRKYGSSLETQLLELINKDYADFVNLSSNLKGIDKVIENLRAPIHSLRNEVLSIYNSIDEEIRDIEEKLAERNELQQKKHYLTLFLDIHQIICKIEALLRVGEENPVQFVNSDEDTSNLIQRVANDFNQLKYYVSRTKEFPFVKNLGDRINRIETTMQEGLEALFCDGLENADSDVIANCLRTYAAIDRIADVEQLFMNTKVNPFLKTVILPSVYEQEGLESIFNQIISWVRNECSLLLDITRKSVKGFDFLTNSVFLGIMEQTVAHVPAVFGAGFPDVFHQNYLIFLRFLDRWEEFLVSRSELKEFRESSVYNDFMKRWNVSIYFGLRYQGIARVMEKALEAPVQYQGPSSAIGTPMFSFSQTTKLWEELKECWSPKIFIPALTDSFFKLSLQLIARYSSWVSTGIHEFKTPAKEGAELKEVVIWTKILPEEQEQFISVYQDMETLTSCLPTSYLTVIKSQQNYLSDDVFAILRKAYSNVASLTNAKQLLGNVLCEKIIQQCLVSLQPVKGIMQTYRITNKAPSTHPSFYVQNIFSNLHKFLASEVLQSISQTTKTEWIHIIAAAVTTRYMEWAVDMLQTAQKQNTILKKFIKTAKESETASALRVDEKIAIQLSLDVVAYGEELKKLGIQLEAFAPFGDLSECYRDSLPEVPQ